jgi:dTDP-4-dehydrorhamnose reductase
MKILILGANGILGHTLLLYLNKNFQNIDIMGLCGKNFENTKFQKKYASNLVNIDLLDFRSLQNIVNNFKPDFVVNCSVKKKFSNLDHEIGNSIFINSILPHNIANLSISKHFKFIQISTDSVFGNFGKNKNEDSELIVQDLYSASKALGEPINPSTIVLRTSLIGHSLSGDNGLLDWTIRQNSIFGFENQIYAGLTSLELSKIICLIIFSDKFYSGIFHVSGQSISKYNLIKLIIEKYNLSINLTKEKSQTVDRSLCSDKFKNQFHYSPPTWDSLLNELNLFYIQNKFLYA